MDSSLERPRNHLYPAQRAPVSRTVIEAAAIAREHGEFLDMYSSENPVGHRHSGGFGHRQRDRIFHGNASRWELAVTDTLPLFNRLRAVLASVLASTRRQD